MKLNLTSALSWLRQPTTILGLAGVAGTATSMAMGQMNVATALPLLVGSAVGLAMPDNTGLKSQAMRLAAEAVTAGATRSPAAIGVLMNDAAGMAVSAATVQEVVSTVAAAAPIVAAVQAAAVAGKPAA